jgi:hypothetical protein
MAYPTYSFNLTNGSPNDATQVQQNFTDILNGVSDGTKDLCVKSVSATSGINVAGTAAFGGAVSIAGSAAVAGDIYSVALASWPSASMQSTGWVAPTSTAFYKKIGKTVHFWYKVTGTSNNSSVQFYAPITAAMQCVGNCWQYTTGPSYEGNGIARINDGSGTRIVTAYWKGDTTQTWCSAGAKQLEGYLCYEAA